MWNIYVDKAIVKCILNVWFTPKFLERFKECLKQSDLKVLVTLILNCEQNQFSQCSQRAENTKSERRWKKEGSPVSNQLSLSISVNFDNSFSIFIELRMNYDRAILCLCLRFLALIPWCGVFKRYWWMIVNHLNKLDGVGLTDNRPCFD